MNKFGRIIIPFGVVPEPHEIRTAQLLIMLGHDVEFLAPVYSKGVRTPDIVISGTRWEIKCPSGSSKRTIENNYVSAAGQCENVIFDIRAIKIPEERVIKEIRRQFKSRARKVKRIIIITKNNKILDLNRGS